MRAGGRRARGGQRDRVRPAGERRWSTTGMPRFSLSPEPFAIEPLREAMDDARAGAYAGFEGRVRNHNDGRAVDGLHYEAYAALAAAEGERVLSEALERFDILEIGRAHVCTPVPNAHPVCRLLLD